MAKAGAKQRLEENRRKITFLTWLIIASAVTFAVIRLGMFRSTSSGMLVAAYVITLLMSLGSFGALRSASAPVFAASGELIDGGADLKKSGVTESMLDWIYLTAAVHLLGSFLDIAWYLYWLAPVYLGFVVWTKVIKRIRDASAAEPVEMDEETRKKLEKKQAKAERKRTRGMRAF